MSAWAVQDAKARLSEVMNAAEKKGPQTTTRRGAEVAVVGGIKDWKRMNRPTPSQPPKKLLSNDEFLALLRSGPAFEVPDRHAERVVKARARKSS